VTRKFLEGEWKSNAASHVSARLGRITNAQFPKVAIAAEVTASNHNKAMSSDYSPSSSRGPRRSRGRRPGQNRGEQRSRPQAASKPKEKTLWQKITSFFAGEPEPAASPRSTSTTNQPPREREERRERSESKPRESRPPELIEVTSPRLYVGNLSFDATESDLQELFSGAGSVVSAEIVINRHNQRSKGFGFVQMQSVDEAKRAVDVLHEKDFMGRKLLVSGAKAVEERGSDRSAQPEQ